MANERRIKPRELKRVINVLEINEYDYFVVRRQKPELDKLVIGIPQCSIIIRDNFDFAHFRGVMEQEGFTYEKSYYESPCRRFFECSRYKERVEDCSEKEFVYEFVKST